MNLQFNLSRLPKRPNRTETLIEMTNALFSFFPHVSTPFERLQTTWLSCDSDSTLTHIPLTILSFFFKFSPCIQVTKLKIAYKQTFLSFLIA